MSLPSIPTRSGKTKHSRMLLRVLIATLFFVQFGAQRLRAQDADTLQKAKAEGAAVFYTSAGLTEMKPLVDGFSKKFPFIKVELYRAISEKLLNKILTEERAQTRSEEHTSELQSP